MRVLSILGGILAIIAGGICIAHPFESQLVYGYMGSIMIGLVGILSIVTVIATRKERAAARAAGIEVASGAVGIILGILGVVFMWLNMSVPFFTYAVAEVGAVMLMFYLLIDGIMSIVAAIMAKGAGAGMRIASAVVGILMVALAVWGIAFPPMVIASLGIFMGVGFLIVGVNRIIFAFAARV